MTTETNTEYGFTFTCENCAYGNVEHNCNECVECGRINLLYKRDAKIPTFYLKRSDYEKEGQTYLSDRETYALVCPDCDRVMDVVDETVRRCWRCGLVRG